MRLATIEVGTPVGPARRVAVVDEAAYVDVTTAYAALLAERGEADPVPVAETLAPPDMRTLLSRGDRGMDAAREVREAATADDLPETGLEGARVRFDADEVRLLAPLPRPNSFRDCMVFEEHVRRASGSDPPEVWYEQPIYYKGNPDTIVGPGETVEWPAYSETMDYELELAAVVGRHGTDVPAEEGESYIAGYTILNDFSARDAQGREMEGRLGPAKGKDFASALGPYLVTADAFDAGDARMTAEVNDERWSEGNAGEMHHSFADIVAHVSQSEPLVPGDVLGSGTVGSGCGLELDRFLSDGDTVRLEVEGIGTLENRVVRTE